MRVIGMVLICERHCVPLRLCWPPVPPTSRALPPLCALPVCPPVLLVFFFVFCCVFALPAAPTRPACAPCSFLCYACPAALRPLSCLSPLQFSFSPSTLPVPLSSLSVPRCHSCVPPACSTPAPPPGPYPFPWGLPHPSAPSVPASHPILVAWRPVCVGGGLSVDWTVALPEVWHGPWLPTHHEPPHVPNEHRVNVRETLVDFPSLHFHCGAQPHRQGSHSVAPRRCPMAPVAIKAWRGQPLRAGRTEAQCFQCSTILSCRELFRLVPSRRIARTPRLPVQWGATVTWLHCTGFEYTCTATCPSQQSLRSHH